jgi:hypothetical protein
MFVIRYSLVAATVNDCGLQRWRHTSSNFFRSLSTVYVSTVYLSTAYLSTVYLSPTVSTMLRITING